MFTLAAAEAPRLLGGGGFSSVFSILANIDFIPIIYNFSLMWHIAKRRLAEMRLGSQLIPRISATWMPVDCHRQLAHCAALRNEPQHNLISRCPSTFKNIVRVA
jgi:hypothetical protein